MELEKQNILFLTRTMNLGGTENVILQLCEIFNPKVNKIVVCSCGGVNVEKLNKMGIKHYKISDIASKNPNVMLKTFFKIKKIIKDEKITVIHSHHRMAALYARVTANKNIVRIANAHNTFYDKKKLTRFAYNRTNLIAVGQMVKKNLVDYFELPQDQVKVIHNAVKPFEQDIETLEILNKEKQKGYILIGNVGRLSEQKGIEYFIEAASKVHKNNSKIKFVIVGEGEDRNKLEKLAEEKKIEEYVIFLGYRSDIQNVISQMDFIVLSSLWEGLPLTPIEAFSVGKTVVATNVDGTPEIVQDGENGYLVEPKDSEALAERMLYLSENKNKREELEIGAKKTYDEEFAFEQLTQRYIDYYERL